MNVKSTVLKEASDATRRKSVPAASFLPTLISWPGLGCESAEKNGKVFADVFSYSANLETKWEMSVYET